MVPRSIPAGVLLAPLILLFAGGCSTYVSGYYYAPRPAVALVPASQPTQPPPTAAIVSIIGVHREDRGAGIPESVEVRIRIENNGPEGVVFDPHTMELLDGGLMGFPLPVVQPAQPISLAPGQAVVVAAYFPFPTGRSYSNTDLETLQLRWRLMVGGGEVGQTADFRRTGRPYYYPYPAYPYGPGPFGNVSVGVGFGGRFR